MNFGRAIEEKKKRKGKEIKEKKKTKQERERKGKKRKGDCFWRVQERIGGWKLKTVSTDF